jgi:hypothetical protein
MFAMVTPPVLFFAHALSNYSDIFNKINTFFQKFYAFCVFFSALVSWQRYKPQYIEAAGNPQFLREWSKGFASETNVLSSLTF